MSTDKGVLCIRAHLSSECAMAGKLLRTIIFSAHRTSWHAIEELLNAVPNDLQDKQTARWRDYKLRELSFVGITV